MERMECTRYTDSNNSCALLSASYIPGIICTRSAGVQHSSKKLWLGLVDSYPPASDRISRRRENEV